MPTGGPLHGALLSLAVVTVSAASLALQSCRDAPAPYDPGEPAAPEAVRRITFDERDDRAPTWTSDGERIVYVRGNVLSTLTDLPTLLSIPPTGGTTELVFPDLQTVSGSGGRPFTVPAVDLRTDRIAFQHRIRLAPEPGCGDVFWLCESSGHPVPPTVVQIPLNATDPAPPHLPLDLFTLRVRSAGDVGELENGPGVDVQIPGRREDPTAVNPPLIQPVVGRIVLDYYPAYRMFARDGTLFFRPSWNPVVDEIVFSDGYELSIWRVGDASASPIPGTTDAISPAWSPDGQWIAFVRLERTQEVTDICGNFQSLDDGRYFPDCAQETIDYGLGRAVVEITRPDGSDSQVIGEGMDPAWTPDGHSLYIRRDGVIRRLGIENDSDLPVPDTEGGREPAVSPDGTQLAFTRAVDGLMHDIWVVPAIP